VFNPPHIGHLVCAQEAWWQLALDVVLLVPVGEAPHRRVEADPGPEERYELCRLAAEEAGWLGASRAEVDRPGPSYTADTLESLSREGDLVFLLGADQAVRLGQWHDPGRVLQAAAVGVVEREGIGIDEVRTAVAKVGEAQIEAFAMPRIDVSSTDVRARIEAGRPYRFLLPDRVADRIERVGLYR
jgi:nicotinate-nucleotide adenylyltransferase